MNLKCALIFQYIWHTKKRTKNILTAVIEQQFTPKYGLEPKILNHLLHVIHDIYQVFIMCQNL